jgi:hypothetical protein
MASGAKDTANAGLIAQQLLVVACSWPQPFGPMIVHSGSRATPWGYGLWCLACRGSVGSRWAPAVVSSPHLNDAGETLDAIARAELDAAGTPTEEKRGEIERLLSGIDQLADILREQHRRDLVPIDVDAAAAARRTTLSNMAIELEHASAGMHSIVDASLRCAPRPMTCAALDSTVLPPMTRAAENSGDERRSEEARRHHRGHRRHCRAGRARLGCQQCRSARATASRDIIDALAAAPTTSARSWV